MSCIVTLSGVVGRPPHEVAGGAVEIPVKTVSMVTVSDGVHKEHVEWHRVVFTSRRLVEMATGLIAQGSRVFLAGRLVYKGDDRQAYIVVGNDGHLTVDLYGRDAGSTTKQEAPSAQQDGGKPIGRVIVDNTRCAHQEAGDDVPF